ncbi:MAG: transcription elongation factor GreA [Gammaproteobacteria bacterium]|nr:transcription elongation factor GreA [Gammaproteobacteria bacterium]CAJ2375927.1 MAG: transcription elongation factor GreA [Arenicellales bacterium IbO2]MDA7962057.1 transcription elongation factor GreA [Gammaproteobacteria bacterium]MDA7968038.1 transcription elongation factor GreA [Gammaproteobacteria bacterium]MDA7969209.1 transcription elongation factor GreA [Gammaproteobacteria bacterium]
MTTERILLTRNGVKTLRAELRQLKDEERPKVIEAIAEARSHGDLSENAEYDAAKEQQRFVEGRIRELEASLSRAEVIDPAEIGKDGAVVFGATLLLYDEQNDAEVTYQLVGNLEADLEQGRISISSPIGRALLGKREGDEVEVAAPAGKRIYEILKVRYD